MELHNIERTLSNEREEHLNEIKRLNALLIEKEAALEEMKNFRHGQQQNWLMICIKMLKFCRQLVIIQLRLKIGK
ncbi:hypothetical protein ACFX13_035334 [Malus domestica]